MKTTKIEWTDKTWNPITVRGNDPLSTVLIPYPNISAADVQYCYLVIMSEDGMKVSDSTLVQVV